MNYVPKINRRAFVVGSAAGDLLGGEILHPLYLNRRHRVDPHVTPCRQEEEPHGDVE